MNDHAPTHAATAHTAPNHSVSLLIGLVIVALIIRRQLRTRPVRPRASLIGPAVLGVLGVAALAFGVASVVKEHPLTPPVIALVVATLVIGVPLGLVRATTVRVWHDPERGVLRQGTLITTALWLVSAAVHAGMAEWIDHTAAAGLLGFSTLYLYLCVTYGVQGHMVRRRAAALPS
ncbi:hypothetical protein ACFY0R_08045 [Streptomyces sp. NPDC001633]|uniref:hypothetical protein n=1 Tax=Streptomyces sp. NPDC001633 TaxID=3364595 RepID=UPI0036C0C78C